MNKRRIARMNEQLRREIAEIVQRETRDPRIGAVTVTDARVTPDLQQARIFVSVAGDEADRETTLAGLAAATPFIRSALAGRLDLRRVPELAFMLDTSLDYALHIERLLHEVLPHGEPAVEGAEREPADEQRGAAEAEREDAPGEGADSAHGESSDPRHDGR